MSFGTISASLVREWFKVWNRYGLSWNNQNVPKSVSGVHNEEKEGEPSSPNLPKSVDGVYHEEEEGEPQPKHGNCPEVGVFWGKKDIDQ